MYDAGKGFRTQQISRPHLYADSTQFHGSRHTVGRSNATCGDHRHIHPGNDLRHQGKSAHLKTQVVGEEAAPVAASFRALGNNGIDTARLKPKRFRNREFSRPCF